MPARNRAAKPKEPLWMKVTATLQDRIDNGTYQLGFVLPREVDLALELNVSRNTIRHALQQLTNDGFLERRKRGGTRIASLGPSMKLRVDLDPQSSLKTLSQGSELEVHERRKGRLPDSLRKSWQDTDKGEWHLVKCTRVTRISRKPLSSTHVYLAPDLEDISKLIGARPGQQFRLIEERHQEHIVHTKTLLDPVIIDTKTAEILKVKAQGLALRVTHAMIDDHNKAREVVISIYPEERFKFELSFNLEDHTEGKLEEPILA